MPVDVAIECALLKAIATHYVMHSAAVEQRRLSQHHLLHDVVPPSPDPHDRLSPDRHSRPHRRRVGWGAA